MSVAGERVSTIVVRADVPDLNALIDGAGIAETSSAAVQGPLESFWKVTVRAKHSAASYEHAVTIIDDDSILPTLDFSAPQDAITSIELIIEASWSDAARKESFDLAERSFTANFTAFLGDDVSPSERAEDVIDVASNTSGQSLSMDVDTPPRTASKSNACAPKVIMHGVSLPVPTTCRDVKVQQSLASSSLPTKFVIPVALSTLLEHQSGEIGFSVFIFVHFSEIAYQPPVTGPKFGPFSAPAREAFGIAGIKNQGATCYLNSLLQTLFWTPLFRKVVYECPVEWLPPSAAPVDEDVCVIDDDVVDVPADSKKHLSHTAHYATTDANMADMTPIMAAAAAEGLHPNGDVSKRHRVIAALQHMFLDMEGGATAAATTKRLTSAFGWDRSESFVQHDVQEMCRILMDKLEEALKETPLRFAVRDLFQGSSVSLIRAPSVNYASTPRSEHFYDIQLPIRGCTSIYDCFDRLVAPQPLEGDNQYNLEGHGKVDAERVVKFAHLPPILHLQLVRFDLDYTTGRKVKINSRCEFPERLDLTRYIGQSPTATSPPVTHHRASLQSSIEATSCACEAARCACGSAPALYSLHSVLVHSGQAESGHYYAYVRPVRKDHHQSSASIQYTCSVAGSDANFEVKADTFKTDKTRGWNGWFRLNDEKVEPVTAKEAISNNFGTDDTSTFGMSAYYLVYVRDSVWPEVMCEPGSALFKNDAANQCEIISPGLPGKPFSLSWQKPKVALEHRKTLHTGKDAPALTDVAAFDVFGEAPEDTLPLSAGHSAVLGTKKRATKLHRTKWQPSPFFVWCHIPVSRLVIRRIHLEMDREDAVKVRGLQQETQLRRLGQVMLHVCVDAHTALSPAFRAVQQATASTSYTFDVLRPEFAFRICLDLSTKVGEVPHCIYEKLGVSSSNYRLWLVTQRDNSVMRISAPWPCASDGVVTKTASKLEDCVLDELLYQPGCFFHSVSARRSVAHQFGRACRPGGFYSSSQDDCLLEAFTCNTPLDMWDATLLGLQPTDVHALKAHSREWETVSTCLQPDLDSRSPSIRYHSFAFLERLPAGPEIQPSNSHFMLQQTAYIDKALVQNQLAAQKVLWCALSNGGQYFATPDRFDIWGPPAFSALEHGVPLADWEAAISTACFDASCYADGMETSLPPPNKMLLLAIHVFADALVTPYVSNAQPTCFETFQPASPIHSKTNSPAYLGIFYVPLLATVLEAKIMLSQWLGLAGMSAPAHMLMRTQERRSRSKVTTKTANWEVSVPIQVQDMEYPLRSRFLRDSEVLRADMISSTRLKKRAFPVSADLESNIGDVWYLTHHLGDHASAQGSNGESGDDGELARAVAASLDSHLVNDEYCQILPSPMTAINVIFKGFEYCDGLRPGLCRKGVSIVSGLYQPPDGWEMLLDRIQRACNEAFRVHFDSLLGTGTVSSTASISSEVISKDALESSLTSGGTHSPPLLLPMRLQIPADATIRVLNERIVAEVMKRLEHLIVTIAKQTMQASCEPPVCRAKRVRRDSDASEAASLDNGEADESHLPSANNGILDEVIREVAKSAIFSLQQLDLPRLFRLFQVTGVTELAFTELDHQLDLKAEHRLFKGAGIRFAQRAPFGDAWCWDAFVVAAELSRMHADGVTDMIPMYWPGAHAAKKLTLSDGWIRKLNFSRPFLLPLNSEMLLRDFSQCCWDHLLDCFPAELARSPVSLPPLQLTSYQVVLGTDPHDGKLRASWCGPVVYCNLAWPGSNCMPAARYFDTVRHSAKANLSKLASSKAFLQANGFTTELKTISRIVTVASPSEQVVAAQSATCGTVSSGTAAPFVLVARRDRLRAAPAATNLISNFFKKASNTFQAGAVAASENIRVSGRCIIAPADSATSIAELARAAGKHLDNCVSTPFIDKICFNGEEGGGISVADAVAGFAADSSLARTRESQVIDLEAAAESVNTDDAPLGLLQRNTTVGAGQLCTSLPLCILRDGALMRTTVPVVVVRDTGDADAAALHTDVFSLTNGFLASTEAFDRGAQLIPLSEVCAQTVRCVDEMEGPIGDAAADAIDVTNYTEPVAGRQQYRPSEKALKII